MNTQIYEEACEWFVEFRAGEIDASARQRFYTWLRTSPEHVRAYLELAAIWNEGAALDPKRKYTDDELIALARTEDNVVPLAVPSSVARVSEQTSSSVAHPWRKATLAASVLVATAGALAWLFLQQGTYATDVGEQRSIALTDGSTVELNSRSRIRVRYTDHERALELLEGQALFRVAKDPTRPFTVRSDATRVRAVGTQFDVYRKHSGTVVTVLEGRVAIAEPAARANEATQASEQPSVREIVLAAGEQVIVQPGLVPTPKTVNLIVATAWTQRQLVFESASLAEVAEEFNRYNTRQLIIEDAGTSDFHISGVFSSTDPASLLRFLRERPGIQVTEADDHIIISRQ